MQLGARNGGKMDAGNTMGESSIMIASMLLDAAGRVNCTGDRGSKWDSWTMVKQGDDTGPWMGSGTNRRAQTELVRCECGGRLSAL